MLEKDIYPLIASALKAQPHQVEAAAKLLDEGNTVPFIARYRKEATGSLEDEKLRELEERLAYLRGLVKRQEEVLAKIEEQGKLTDELRQSIEKTRKLQELEDLYLPYKPKRKTRAEMARQKGLTPLATLLMLQKDPAPDRQAKSYVKGDVKSVEEALKGACDIIAEQVSEDERSRHSTAVPSSPPA